MRGRYGCGRRIVTEAVLVLTTLKIYALHWLALLFGHVVGPSGLAKEDEHMELSLLFFRVVDFVEGNLVSRVKTLHTGWKRGPTGKAAEAEL